ncbi:MAG TPA: DNA polymerase I [Azospirillaceae bacterium]|nr:DNA polymerase I [Azospirillaceae bacterium]
MTDVPTAEPRSPGTPSGTGKPAGLYLVDGSGYIFRAFHALPPMNRPDGTPVNAVYGFTGMLMRLLADLHAEAVAVVFDANRNNWRNAVYDQYKANRSETPPELVPQFPLIREAVDAFNLPALELEGYEADDLIATYAKVAAAEGIPVTIVSSDKDLMQLVGPGVRMWDPIKQKPIEAAEVAEKFGVPPEKVVDVQALAGDSVDNVPGVPGIGIKTAAQLIAEYGDLETLLARAGEIKQPKRRECLIQYADQARISKRLVQLDANAPMPLPVTDLTVRAPDPVRLVSFLRAQGFRSLVQRVEQEAAKLGVRTPVAPPAVSGGASSAPDGADEAPSSGNGASDNGAVVPSRRTEPDGPANYELVDTVEALDRWIAMAAEAGVVAVDTETDSLLPSAAKLVGVSLSVTPGRACYIPLGHVAAEAPVGGELDFSDQAPPRQIPLAEAVARLKPLLENPSVLKVGHNLKFDWQVLRRHGIEMAPWDDTMLISYVLDCGRHNHGMDDLAARHCNHTTISYDSVTGTGRNRITFDRVPLDKACTYAAEDADITLRLWRVLKPRLVRERATALYETIERPLVRVVAEMETRGIRVDPRVLQDLSRRFGERLQRIEAEIHGLAGRVFNVGSTKQLGDVLFGDLGLPGGRKLKTGGYSTDSAVLEPLAEQGHDIAAKVLAWRQTSKLRSTYTDALQEQIQKDGRVHTSFSLALTNTGRLSSSDPNLQNIPIRTEEGREIRRAFVAEPGCKLLSVDYSQIELRLIAEIAGIDAMKEAFNAGIDIHAATAHQVFGVPLDQINGDLRRRAKTINFGIIYGISGFGLGQRLGIPPGEANRFIQQYLDKYWQLRDYMEKTKEECRATGYVTTLFGRRCHIQGIRDQNPNRRASAERQAINAPIQGTAADIIKRAMVRIPGALDGAGLKARMLLQVHDELLFEVPEAEVEATTAVVRAVMEGAANLSVPLLAEAGAADNWADAH